MMKKALLIPLTLMLAFCSENKKVEQITAVDQEVHAEYDTLAVDSFSAGATSVDVAARIRLSSRRYQDSLLLVRKKEEAVKIANDLAAKEKVNAAKLELNKAVPAEENTARTPDNNTKNP